MAASGRPPRNRSVATPPFRRATEQTGAPERDVRLADVDFQLASRAPRAFTRSGWWFELKYDGYRILAERRGRQVRLRYRGGSDPSEQFPEVVESLRSLPSDDFILDGEVVVEDSEGRPSFSLLQQRAQRARPPPGANPATYWTFDLLAAEGRDLRGLPLARRRELLRGLTADGGRVRCVEPVETEGEAFYEAVKQMGLEGIVAKRSDGAHHAGRGTDWQKVVTHHVGDFAVVGHTRELTSLALATHDGTDFVYAGRAGSGLAPRQASRVERELGQHRRPTPPCRDAPRDRDLLWVDPTLVAEVRYKEWERGGSPRAPVFCRFRDDRRPEQCLPPWRSEERTVNFVNLEKIWFPEDGFSKGDLIRYYQAISPWMLPYLRDRPLMLTRFPDGIHGESFFQKQAGGPYVPSWVHTVQMEGEEGPIRQFVCEDAETLSFLVNLGTIPFHLWSARVADLEHPDWCILDLDPKAAPFEHVITLAIAARALCEELELPHFIKTSGSSGLHVLVPLQRQLDHEAAISFGQVLAEALVQQHPTIATTERAVRARRSKVYVDYLQNGRGKLLAAPYSARPLPGVPVSMPLRWAEVTSGLHPRQFTALDAPARMERLGEDPFLGVLGEAPELVTVLSRLQRYLEKRGGLSAPVGGPTRTGRWGGPRKDGPAPPRGSSPERKAPAAAPAPADTRAPAQGRTSRSSSSGGRRASPGAAARQPAPRGRRRRPSR
jgi:bifunctional non-homologous end joining protein LigD